MLSFFRSIRRSLLNEGKTSKYIRYAVGEFLLIVAGILVALQIQNWNEGNKLDQERLKLIDSLKSEMLGSLKNQEEVLLNGEGRVESMRLFLELALSEMGIPVHELKDLSRHGAGGFQFELNLPTYEQAVSTGKLELIDDTEIKARFIELFQHGTHLNRLVEYSSATALIGSRVDLYKQVGSRTALRAANDPFPAAPLFQLTDAEYRDFIIQRDVYATYEMIFALQRNKLERLQSIGTITEQIIADLEALE